MEEINTIKDLARLAGVSVGSASMVMNGKWHKKVKKEVVENVLKIASEHNYELNPLGRSLQLKQFFRVAILIEGTFTQHPLLGAFSFYDFIGIVSDKLNLDGYSLDIIQLDLSKQEQIIKSGRFSNNVDAFIFLQWDSETLKRIFSKVKINKPYVIIGDNLKSQNLNCIYRSTKELTYHAIMHFLKNGHKRVAISKVAGSDIRFQEKLSGYRKALQEVGIDFDSRLVVDLKYKTHSMNLGEKLAKIYTSFDSPPTAYFCDENIDAIGMIVYFEKKGYKIPEEIEIIGYGDEALADMGTTLLSYIKIPTKEIAETAVDYIISVLKSKSPLILFNKQISEKIIFQKTTR